MELTTIGLKKPTQNEFYDIGIHNDNMDLLDSLVKNISNPNLLINGGLDINEYNATEYAVTTEGAMVCDRWKKNNSYGVATWNTDGSITLDATDNSGDCVVVQRIKNGNSLNNKTVTMSINIEGVRYSGVMTVNGNGAYAWVIPNEAYLSVWLDGENILHACFAVGKGQKHTFDNAKLEVGDVATPYYPKPIDEELLECQRYYIRYSIVSRMFEGGIEGGKMVIDLPVRMAKVPSVVYFDSTMTYTKMGNENSTTISVTNVGISNASNNAITLMIVAPFGFTEWTACACENLGIALSAEI